MAEQNASINGSTGGNDYSGQTEFFRKLEFAEPLFIWMISAIEIPIMILTLFALCVLITSHRSAPVFVIHLILSDVIQVICALMKTSERFKWRRHRHAAYDYSLIVGMYFMACVAVERYLLVSHPIWYKSHQSLKVSCVISVIVWFVPLIFGYVDSIGLYFNHQHRVIACLIPYPIVILCFVGTCRGLSRAISLTPLKRKLILGSLFLVLVTYTFLTLPFVIMGFILTTVRININVLVLQTYHFLKSLLFLNPLADCLLYLFMRPDVGGLMKSARCCCRTDTHPSRDRSVTFACSVSHSQTACTSV